MPPKTDLSDAIANLALQLQDLKQSLETKIDNVSQTCSSSISDLHAQISRLETRPSPAPPPLPSILGKHSTAITSSSSPESSFPEPHAAFQPKTPKFHLLPFDGSNPHAWIFQAEQYFAFYSITPPQRLPIVAFYQREFEILANRVSGLTEEHLLNCFVSGLKPDIQTEVVIQCPTTLPHALALAKLIEAKLLAHPGFFNRSSTPNSSLSTPASRLVLPAPPSRPALPAPPPRLALPTPNPPIRRLTPAEMQARRAKGLCFNCDEQYKPGHKCKTAPFLLLRVDEEPPDALLTLEAVSSPPLSAIPLPPPPEAFDQTVSEDFHVSFHALYGLTSVKCMRLQGIINGHTFTVLIDSGSSHNLIQPRVAQFLNLAIEPALPFVVTVGNGDSLKCLGQVKSIAMAIQEHLFSLDFFLLNVFGADIILGIQWLAQLGPILADFSQLYMSFLHNGQTITLHGENATKPTSVSYHQVRRLAQTDGIAWAQWLAISPVQAKEASNPVVHPLALEELLSEFQLLFELPKGEEL
ncbi:Retroviral aspartyl protease [Corchorus olitorius]|uniref:Retroviral aspartyl protease n=1 Tax=Corchorus olitorius TaxID=93759 RepID=A0A1R3K7L7_9ROSI|nr:Retroviral aspartyl protease [Corchorus olitorius]